MTFLLASVTGPDEAEIAVAHGADVVDLKDPARGALGMVEPAVVRATVAAVARRRLVSAVVGELAMEPETMTRAAEAMAETGVDYVKVGLLPEPKRADCIRALSSLARRTKVVGVMFADQGADFGLVPLMAESGFAGALLDTALKGSGRLLDHLDIPALGEFVEICRARGLAAGLAGSLEAPDVPRLRLLVPDVLGFRSALCRNGERTAPLDPAAVDVIRALIPPDPRRTAEDAARPAKVDYRLLAARGYSLEPRREDSATDRIFVRDFVIPVRIGAYSHERAKPQNVRFNIDAHVLRPAHAAQDIRDVFSYDVITDAIRMIVAQEHIELVEILAERIAAVILTYRQVASVTIRVEKLDVGPGGIGVEITRKRPAETAKMHQLFPAAAAEADPKAAR